MASLIAFFSAIGSIPSLIGGLFGTINGVTKALSDAKLAQIKATTQEEQIHAQERVSALTLRRDVLIADAAHSTIDMWMRVGFSIGPIAVLIKIFVYDKALGQWTFGHTDQLGDALWQVIMVELGFYFLYTSATTIAKIAKGR